jgi:predicted TIM-barrel fold metal-dependent hydrolase
MNNIKYFNCHATIGKYEGKDPAAPWTTEDLLAEMDRCQIHGALVYSHLAATVNPEVGNPMVTETCKKHSGLFPCWVTLPHHSGEYLRLKPKELLLHMEENTVRTIKLFPRSSKFRVDQNTLGQLLNLMQEAELLLIFDRGEYENDVQIEWQELEWLCENFPRLPVLLHKVRWESTRTILPIAERFQNLYFEFSNYQGNRMLEFWCNKIGHERLLFGTQSPQKSMGAARAYIDYSDLTADQRIAIAGENLLKLLKLDETNPNHPHKEIGDKILIKARSGSPINDMTVIDAHAHITHKGGKGASMVVMNQADAKGVVERNRRIGVNKTCVSAWTAIWGDYELGNKDTIQAKKDFPNEIIGYVALDPNYVTDWKKECNYYHQEHQFPGMKPYFPKMGIPYNHAWFDPWWEYGNEHHLFALMHPSDNFQAEIEELANKYPNISFLLAHSGWTWKTVRTHVELAEQFPNCFLELTFTSVLNGSIEYMVKEVGSERVLYGSDAPMRDPYPQFGWVAYADISERDKRNILGRNMEKIIKKVTI